ncbi:MAG TPA: lipopolysaccharide heptosyltransferase family protein [Chlamydiae bacterium]|nr:lipopolysaccharide heptosyltransferase family protein [Chlamydiota bacterium]
MKKKINKATPLKGKYLVKNPLLYTFLKSVDFFSLKNFKILKILKLEFFKSKITLKNEKIELEKLLKKPKKILLSNIAHLGDVLISLKAATILKEKYPKAKIGFVCSSVSRQIIEKFSLIDKIFVVDHWKINREEISNFKKIRKYLGSRKKIITEIKKEKYDVAIDLHYNFPNSIYLFYKSKIPIRIGYSSAGFENYLTHSQIWENRNQHVFSYHLDLLKFLNVDSNNKDLNIEPKLVKISNDIFTKEFVNRYKDQNQKSLEKFDLPNHYIIFHIGAGSLKKMWDINKWQELTKKLLEMGKKIVFTGKGKYESSLISEIIKSQNYSKEKQIFFKFEQEERNNYYQKKLFNLSDKLNFSELSHIVKNAKLVICVDSFILHLSTALDKPTIVIYSGINNATHWTEKKQNIIPIVKKMDCNPCYMKNGCKSMICLNTIKIDDILAKIKRFECKS